MDRLRPPLRVGLLLGIWLLAGCGSGRPPPPPREPEPVLHTEAQDRQAGEKGATEVAAEIGLLEDPALNAYVSQIGQRLARNAPSGRFQYSFQVVDQDAPNAFALPGGFVFVSRGLLALSNSEDELANVLGHEIVHVARRHAAGRQSILRDLPAIFQYIAMGQVAAYSRDQERESDRLGQGLAAVSGYDPAGLASFLRDLEYTERLRLGFSRVPGFFDTHPATSERVAAAGARARTIRWTPQPGVARTREDYLRRLDGLVIGTGATEGVVQRDRFLHPEMDFSLRFPAGWDVINTRQAVGAVSPRRDAQVVLELQGSGSDPEQASVEFLEKAESQGLRVERSMPVRIGEFPGFRVEGRASTPLAPLGVHLTWIVRDGTVYRITGVAVGSAGRLEGVFHSVPRSFRPLTPRERRSIRETRLRIVPAGEGESLAEISRRSGNAWDIQQTAVVNGVFADARFRQGELVKVAISQPYRSSQR